jgi:hypothetical protein
MMRTAQVGAIDDQVWTGGDGSVVRTRHQRRRRAVASLLLVLVGLGITYVPIAMALSRWQYGTFVFWKPPDRIDYCGRRYDQGSVTVPGTPASLTSSFKAPRVQWTEVARTFSLQPIYAGVLTSHPNSAVCAMFLYVAADHGRWWTYTLGGGP